MSEPTTHRLALPAGTMLGKYRLESVLGSGGFGITYLAENVALKMRVAIKELMPTDIATRVDGTTVVARETQMQEDLEWARQRFLEEAQTLAACGHPAVVQVFDILEDNCTAYIVTKFVEGRNLSEWLKELGRRPTEAELKALVKPLLDGLEVVHGNGFLHRDIKPDNIFISDAGDPILLDFGSARQAISNRSQPMTSIVTPGYAPFEQYYGDAAQDGSQGPWSDVYALSAVLIYAITGARPPEAPARMSKSAKPYMPLEQREELIAGYGADFLGAIDRGFASDAEERPQSVAEWRQEFWRVGGDGGGRGAESVVAEPKSAVAEEAGSEDLVPASSVDRSGGRRILLAVIAVLAVSVLGLGYFAFKNGKIDEGEGRAGGNDGEASGQEPVSSLGVGGPVSVVPPVGDESMEGRRAGAVREFGQIEFVWCPPTGEAGFLMGSLETEEGRGNDETQHRVVLTRGYWLARTECTQGQYEGVMGENPGFFNGSSDLPVENVSWEDAEAYCEKLNGELKLASGWRVSLPTEAQWEYGCRAGTETVFGYGDSLSSKQANFDGTDPYGGAARGVFLKKTTMVGSYPANAWGLHDMHGNVWEWCADGYVGYPEGKSRDPQGDDKGPFHVFRGGSWDGSAVLCRSAYRGAFLPSSRDGILGFRVVLSSQPD